MRTWRHRLHGQLGIAAVPHGFRLTFWDRPAVEQVGAGIGYLDPVPDHMRQGCLDRLPGVTHLFGRPIPEAGLSAKEFS